MNAAPPIIVGAGPAGSAAAILLLANGIAPIVYERQATPGDALCGGFLSWRTLERLQALGLAPGEAGGHRVGRLRITAGTQEWSGSLPAAAMGLSRRRLDSLLLDRARALGAEIRHATVRHEEGAFRADDGRVLRADSIFLATGKHDLRGLPRRPRAAAGQNPFLGLRTRFAPPAAMAAELAGTIEMHLFPGGYAGIVLQEDGSANLCLALRKRRLAEAGGDPLRLFDQLADRAGPLGLRMAALPGQPRVDAIGQVPYGWYAGRGAPGLFRLGDQAGVIPSLAGEGIGIALASAELAVQHWLAHGAGGAERFRKAMAARLRSRLALAQAITAAGVSARGGPWLARLAALPGLSRCIAGWLRID